MLFYPAYIKERPIWILWKLEEREGRQTKVLYSANYDGRASSTNPETWSTYEKVSAKFAQERDQYRGIGVVISKTDRLIFVDVDHCISETGEIDERGVDILSAFNNQQYIEKSQSGSGIHVLALGEIPRSFKNSKNGVEMYSEKRFVALTGDALSACEPHEEDSALMYIFNRYSTPKETKTIHTVPQIPLRKDDNYIVERASMRGSVFPDLYSGDWQRAGYASHSEADVALCVLLCFWTDADPDAIDRIFRSSGLYREKWERDDYRVSTITSACNHCKETLSEFMERKRKEEAEDFERAYISKW